MVLRGIGGGGGGGVLVSVMVSTLFLLMQLSDVFFCDGARVVV